MCILVAPAVWCVQDCIAIETWPKLSIDSKLRFRILEQINIESLREKRGDVPHDELLLFFLRL
jgi:hypothetical protein